MRDVLRVEPGTPAGLDRRDPGARLGLDKAASAGPRDEALEEIRLLQNRLWAEHERAVLVVLQAMDCGGKDGTIRRVFSGVNPQGCRVASFKQPTPTELDHDYLWRVHAACPRRGEIGIFNRSHYEDVVTVRVLGLIDDKLRDRRFEHIREFERLLVEEGTTVLKFFLHISREEQRERLQARLDDPEKRWKFRRDDLDTRRHWDDYQRAYENAITATSTSYAPWHVVPADHKWVRDFAVATILAGTLRAMDPRIPPPDGDLDGIVVV